jgi:hypothetical protein
VEFESADDFALTTPTVIRHATFTGLLTGGATPRDVSNVDVEIYRVFPLDSDTTRTPKVPTRTNSPSDVAFTSRDSADKELNFHTDVLAGHFTAHASVSSTDKISVKSKGNGEVTGEEVEFDINFRNHPLDLPAGHYFFVPQVGLSDTAPAGADFLWLSAPRPIVPPGTPFPAGVTDLQSWMRDDPPLAPDWLRVGADIIGGTPAPTFNAAFSLSGEIAEQGHSFLALVSAAKDSPDFTTSVTGGTSTNQAALLHTPPTAPALGNVPPLAATLTQSDQPRDVTLSRMSALPHGQSIVETALDGADIASAPLVFSTVV